MGPLKAIGVALAAATTLLILPAAAAAADVSVELPRGGETKTVSLASLAAKFDVDADYLIRESSGAQRTERIRGISLAALLDAIDADPVYGGVEVARLAGEPVLVSKAQILATGAVPVVYERDGAVHFLRPSYFGSDVNASDVVTTNGLLQLRQTDTTRLRVEARASKVKVKEREVVRFTATATGGAAGERYTFNWNFDDGKRAEGAKVSHRFSKRGSYSVLVTVRTEGSDRSDPDVVRVRVGKTASSKKNRSGGGTNDSAGAPSSGQSDGASGSGESTAARPPQRPDEPEPEDTPASPALPQVSGQLLNATVVPEQPEVPQVAARTGQRAESGSGTGIPGEAAGAAAALGLLGLGFLLELGAIGKFRPPFLAG